MTNENYELQSVAVLKDMARKRGIKGVSAMRKNDVILALSSTDQSEALPESTPSIQNSEMKAPQDISQAEIPGSENNDITITSVQPEETSPAPIEEHTVSARQGRSSKNNIKRPKRTQDHPQVYGKAKNEPSSYTSVVRSSREAMQRSSKSESPTQRISSKADSLQQETSRNSSRINSKTQRPFSRVDSSPQGTSRSPFKGDSRAAQRSFSRTDLTAQEMARSSSKGNSQTQRSSAKADGQAQRSSKSSSPSELQQINIVSRQNEKPQNCQALDNGDRPPMELRQLDSGNTVSGVLEVMPDGYGFIRSNNYLPGDDDIYVSPSQIRRFNLRTGDIISGNTRVHAGGEKFSALLFVRTINGLSPSEAAGRLNFEDMTPIFPNERLRMERTGREIAMRIVDILSPIGKGQRGLIVSPPKAGKTTLLKDIAHSVLLNNPEMHIIIMLIDERPEEVTDIREAIVGDNVEVLDSTFDETPDHHKRVAEMGIERAKRLVEHCRDVIILLDSITRLARAYNLIVPPSGRTLSGGIDPAALHPPKRFFGSARNMREGGSLTILATALVDTGSKMDDVVYEEFKGTGNMELILDRRLSERRVFPAIDIQKSGTRREDLLLTTDEGEASYVMRRAMNGMKGEDAVERILEMFVRTRNNEELIQRIKHSHVI